MPEKFEIRFSVLAEPGSPEFELLSYLKDPSRTLYPLKDMTMIALTGVWLPLVYRDNQQITQQQLHQAIRDCSHRLMLQVQYFREMEELAVRSEMESGVMESGVAPQAGQPFQPPALQQPEAQKPEYDPEEMFNN